MISLSNKSLWNLNFIDHNYKKYDYTSFVEYIKKNIKEKDFSEILYEKFTIDNLKIIITESKFNEIIEQNGMLQNKYFPVFTFHATNNMSKINSITKNGYLMPGEMHPTESYTLKMQNGKCYGDGIYSTTDVDLAWWFSYIDYTGSISLIINIVLTGDIKFINDAKSEKILDNLFEEKYNNLCDFNKNVFVSASNKYIYPVAILNLSPIANWSRDRYYIKDRSGKLHDMKCKCECDKDVSINMYLVYDNYYLLDVDIKKEETYKLKHLFVVPPHLQFIRIDQINKFINSIESDKILFTYFDKIYKFNVNNVDSFKNHYEKITKNDHKYLLKESIKNTLNEITKSNNNDDFSNIIYLFINKIDTFDDIIDEYKNICSVKNIKIRLIFLNDNLDRKSYYNLKYQLETNTSFDNSTYLLRHKFPNILENILEENYFGLDKKRNLLWKIPFPTGVNGEGFINNLFDYPTWDMTTRSNVIYRGQYIKILKIDDKYYNIKYHENIESNKLEVFCTKLICLINRIRNCVVFDKSKINIYSDNITKIISKLVLYFEYGLKSENCNLNQIKTCHYQLNSILTHMNVYCQLNLNSQWYEKLLNMKFSKNICKRVKHNFNIENINKIVNKDIKECSDGLLSYKKLGLGIQTCISNCSMIEPWTINIKYISNQYFSIDKLYKSCELNEKIVDIKNKKITDVIIYDILNDLDKMYLAYIFTRNPYLYIKSQYNALITVSWVSIMEYILISLMTKKLDGIQSGKQSGEQYDINMNNALHLLNKAQIINKMLAINFSNNLKNNENFEKYLTESHGINSICQVLGYLCYDELKWIFKSDKYNKFAFTIIFECIARNCKSLIKSKNINEICEIRRILGISENIENYNFNLKDAVKMTNVFYKRKYTNCAPFAVVSVLEYLERYHDKCDSDVIKKDFFDKNISMKNYLNKHLPGQSGMNVQVALYLLGIKYNRSVDRQEIKFDLSEKIINEIINENLNMIKITNKNKENYSNENLNFKNL